MNNLTAQVVVRNEPFIYYSIKSVYNYVDKILICDTGSTDYTISDIQQLISEDVDNKIEFNQIILPDLSKWTSGETRRLPWYRGKLTDIAKIRQEQLDKTKTDFFLLLDGDEVHYYSGIESIIKYVIPNWINNKFACNIPIYWNCSLKEYFHFGYWARVFVTDKLSVMGKYPKETYYIKQTKQRLWKDSVFNMDITPYIHFETYVKPWRRNIKRRYELKINLPEVMQNNKLYIDRFINDI